MVTNSPNINISEIINALNPAQKEAVVYDKSLLVLAGAGSGKTKVLTTRIIWLLQTQKILADQILAVTFTNKAASEMLVRVAPYLTDHSIRHIWIGTFHAIAFKLLRLHVQKADLPSNFHIIDNHKQQKLIKQVLSDLGYNDGAYEIKQIQKFINLNKEQGIRSEHLTNVKTVDAEYVKIYKKYEDSCIKLGAVDFTELLLRAYHMLNNHPELLEQYRTKFKHILIDEFQDTNIIQYKFIKLIGQPHAYLFAVGDDDQSIYAFRGAQVDNMRKFIRDFDCEDPIRLEQNYRSTKIILDAANSVISQNSNRIGKNLWTTKNAAQKITIAALSNDEEEADFVIKEIIKLHNQGINYSNIAILYRSNAQSRIFEQYLSNNNIPYHIHGGLKFFERTEIKLVISYLEFISDIHNNEKFLHVINSPTRGLGKKTTNILAEIALKHNISIFQLLLDAVEEKHDILDHFTVKVQQSLVQFTNIIKHLLAFSITNSLEIVLKEVVDSTEIYEHFAQYDKTHHTDKLSNINQLINIAYKTSYTDYSTQINDFLSQLSLDTEDADYNIQAINMMTIHVAKGLEFLVVFLVGLEDGLLPHENSMWSVKALEEERRLMYVAITRAKEILYFTRSLSRLVWGRRLYPQASLFISEIPDDLLLQIEN
jgi:DNA helicase-2/ATP-dependent DNA helicase PcrA